MKIRIHRGAREIGGNCIEFVASAGTRIVLDAGYPLDDEASPGASIPVFGGPLDAAIASHPHLDHYGLIPDLDAPVWIGAEAERVLAASAFFSPATRPLKAAGHLHDHVPLRIGAFTITPYLADHSAFDAYMLLVEADNKRVFYTGDYRGHGRKAALFQKLLACPPAGIDVLLSEGTQMSSGHGASTETELEHELVEQLAATAGLVAVFGSSQNLDRVVTVYRAAKRAGRTFVTDLYGATIASASRTTIPQPGFDNYRVYVPNRQRVLVKQSGEFRRVETIKPCRVFAETLAKDPGGYVVYLPASTAAELIHGTAITEGGLALWSMWDGYLAGPSGKRLATQLAVAGVALGKLHTSGHATVPDIKRLVDALAPRSLVPIHTAAPEQFAALTDRVTQHQNGEWWAP